MQSRKFPASLPGFPYVFSFRFPFLSYSFPVWLLSENIPHTFHELFTFRQDTFQRFEFGMRVNDSFTSQTLAPQIAILSHASRRVLFTFIQNAAATCWNLVTPLSFLKFSSLNGWLRTGLAKIGPSTPAGVESLAESCRPVWNQFGIIVES
jgi:hypothetical protein